MKPVVLAVVALIFYSFNSVIIETKLSKLPPIANMLALHLIIFFFCLPVLFYTLKEYPSSVPWPKLNQWLFLFLFSAFAVCAGMSAFGAYHNGGSLIMITTISALTPLTASFIKYALGHGHPSLTQIIGGLLAILAVVLVVKGGN
ncbi:MAG: EamA family transporter [Patescibacteria group bacterium]